MAMAEPLRQSSTPAVSENRPPASAMITDIGATSQSKHSGSTMASARPVATRA